ncbi:tRNA 5-carboxymethoxyuridine methyltransferase [Streptomyces sp. RB5]|uniref:tRNA 5-carboxymethoxyuridine methyltransferase n=1 Tax=Streptomyces smaragdinus TaxID=2585196 RepID=A0A7K0CP45_9ACTN|nr:methyltransferase [Streptomyces smaragdinus]MQY15266.1 tRNA 5-carboxymethoxyuridine methyltransferase [Streptomyces smaragdinus]
MSQDQSSESPAVPEGGHGQKGSTRAQARTAVVWQVLKEALDRQAKAGPSPVLDVLDTGGGTGNFAVPIAALGHRVTVVDPSPNALFGLQRRAAEAGVAERVRGVQGDAHGLFEVVERGGYDAVLCHGVLEYVDDPAEGMRNAVAALRPAAGTLSVLAAGVGGAVLSRALAGHFTAARRALTSPEGSWGGSDPVPRRFTPGQLRDLVRAEGLEIAAVHGVRIFSDLVPGGLAEQEAGALEALLELELAAAESPAFQAVASRLHLLAVRG